MGDGNRKKINPKYCKSKLILDYNKEYKTLKQKGAVAWKAEIQVAT